MEHSQLKERHDELPGLVDLAKRGDEKAFGEIIELTQTSVYRFLLYLSADVALAKDLCQDTYLYAFEHLREVREPQYLLRWLYVVARHKFLDHKKSPRNRPHAAVETLDIYDPSNTPERRERAIQVHRVFAKLDEEDRTILLLVDVEGQTVAEAADFIQISASAATSRLRRARERFHKMFFL